VFIGFAQFLNIYFVLQENKEIGIDVLSKFSAAVSRGLPRLLLINDLLNSSLQTFFVLYIK